MVRRVLVLTSAIITIQFVCGCRTSMSERTAQVQDPPDPEVGISFFYDRLSPYGQWFQHPQYGWVWSPSGVSVGWQPYTDGQWIYTDDCGWTWDSNWDWGWAPFHYGRWGWGDPMGWFWVPGYEWGPAWVAWRMGPGFIGWAPLPPGVEWHADRGLDFGRIDLDRDIPAGRWIFVQDRFFAEPRLRDHVLLAFRNPTIFPSTRIITRLHVERGNIFDDSIPLGRVEGAAGHRIQHFRLRSVDSVSAARFPREGSGEVRFFRPRVRAQTDVAPPQGSDFERRQQLEREQLMEQHRVERTEQDRQHELERGRQGTNTQELERRQEAERQSLRSEQENQQRMLENRQRGDRGGTGPGAQPQGGQGPQRGPAPGAQPPARR